MISKQLEQDALAFLDEIEKVARDEGYQAAKSEFDAKAEQMQGEYDRRIVEARETYYNEGYKDGKSESPAPVTPELPTEKIVLADGEEYLREKSGVVALFSYTRKYANTNWGTLVLPVALDYNDWCDTFEIAEITGVNVGSTITPVRSVLGWGTSTKANHPYLVRAKSAGERTIRKCNCVVQPSSAGSVVVEKGGKKYTFVGTYAKLGKTELSGKYYSSGGNFVKAVSTCNPMRVILEIS